MTRWLPRSLQGIWTRNITIVLMSSIWGLIQIPKRLKMAVGFKSKQPKCWFRLSRLRSSHLPSFKWLLTSSDSTFKATPSHSLKSLASHNPNTKCASKRGNTNLSSVITTSVPTCLRCIRIMSEHLILPRRSLETNVPRCSIPIKKFLKGTMQMRIWSSRNSVVDVQPLHSSLITSHQGIAISS